MSSPSLHVTQWLGLEDLGLALRSLILGLQQELDSLFTRILYSFGWWFEIIFNFLNTVVIMYWAQEHLWFGRWNISWTNIVSLGWFWHWHSSVCTTWLRHICWWNVYLVHVSVMVSILVRLLVWVFSESLFEFGKLGCRILHLNFIPRSSRYEEGFFGFCIKKFLPNLRVFAGKWLVTTEFIQAWDLTWLFKNFFGD